MKKGPFFPSAINKACEEELQ
uniref:Uncharacterized protein n=1 Tax=Rhizophora mucronata TaxID=61149 RepID=A0A2P2P1X6_RHIMU